MRKVLSSLFVIAALTGCSNVGAQPPATPAAVKTSVAVRPVKVALCDGLYDRMKTDVATAYTAMKARYDAGGFATTDQAKASLDWMWEAIKTEWDATPILCEKQ